MFKLRVRLGLLTQREMEANLMDNKYDDDDSDEEDEVCNLHQREETIPEVAEPKDDDDSNQRTLADIDGEDGHHADASASSSDPEEYP